MACRLDPGQHTLGKAVNFVGVGLHSGRPAAARILPAPAGHGIRFGQRTGASTPTLLASWRHVSDTSLSTTLCDGNGQRFATVEHLLSALHGCGIDNALVEVHGNELPILDGSARAYVEMLREAGTRRQDAARTLLVVERPVGVRDGDRFVLVAPSPHRRFTAEIDFASAAIGQQRRSLCLDDANFADEIAPARTFGFAEDLERLHREGLARGGSRRNAIVVERGRVVNAEGLRYDDEFVRHKLLDLVGDMALAGAPIVGHVFGYRPGHALNTALVRALFAEPGAITAQPADSARPCRRSDPIAAILSQPDRSAWSLWATLLGDERRRVAQRSAGQEAPR